MNQEATERLRRAVDQRLLQMEIVRWSWWQHWRLLARYIQPRLGRFMPWPNPQNRGTPKNQHIVNSTATISSQRFGAGMLSGAASAARPWFRLKPAGVNEEPTGEVRQWLDQVRDRILTVYAEGNYYEATAQCYEHLGVFGSALKYQWADFHDISRFFVPAMGEFYLAVDDRMEVTTAYRKFLLTVGQIMEKADKEGWTPSPTVETLFRNNQLEQEVLIAHTVEPNDDRIEGVPGLKGMAFREVYWEWGQSGATILKAQGHHDKPFSAPRWNVTSNDPYGRSPGMDALGDIIQVQIQEKRKQQAIDKVVNPPMIADARLRNEPASTIPGGVTYAPPGVEAMKPMYQIEPRIDYMEQSIERCEARIKSAFFEDLFLMIANIDRDMTAFEVARRQEEKMLMLGHPLTRTNREMLKADVERTFGIMSRVRFPNGASMIPPPPSQLAGRHLEMEFISILAQAQKAAATSAIERVFAFAGNIAAVKPDVMDNLDADSAVKDYADLIGMPTNIIVPEAKIVQIRTQRAQQQQAGQALQTGLAAAEGAKTLSQTDVGGGLNAISAMTGFGPSQKAAA